MLQNDLRGRKVAQFLDWVLRRAGREAGCGSGTEIGTQKPMSTVVGGADWVEV